ncbi:MAG: hypothetical protein WA726_08785 [Acidimicrobiia bacterium]
MTRLLRLLGWGDLRSQGVGRALRGVRTGEQRDLYLGLGLLALAYLNRTAPKKRLIYRNRVPEGSALVIHHRLVGDPKIEVVRPD